MQKITPFLWFDNNLQDAISFYQSVFKNVTVHSINKMGDQVFSGTFEIEGQPFYALNGGPQFKFTPAISFFISCDTQEQIDYYWSKLLEDGGREDMCGWLQDKFGLSWQVVPAALGRMMSDKDPQKAQRVGTALRQMRKLDIAALEKAFEG